jgi:hypothetical protein
MNRRRCWQVLASVFALGGLAGCGGQGGASGPVDVSGCNPACGAGETCLGVGAGARCEAGGTDAGTTTDLGGRADVVGDVAPDSGTLADGGLVADTGTAADLGTVTDTGAPADVPPAIDAVAIVDSGAVDRPTPTESVFSADVPALEDAPAVMDVVDSGPPARDVGTDDAFVAPMNCGMPGQPCCAGRGCYGGGYCEAGVCHAPTARDPGECNSAADCPAGQGCGGPFVCGGGPDGGVDDAGAIATRRCFHCEAPPGTAAFGAACANGGDCQGGVCSSGRCTVSCPVGEAGDAQCRARGASQRCVNLFFQPVAMGPLTTLGVCAPSCARDADCPADSACVPRLNYFADRMDFVCAPPNASATTAVGGACNPSGASACRNVLCVGTSASAGYCTAPCTVDGDCPAAAPSCAAINYSRPSGAGQPGRSCAPR